MLDLQTNLAWDTLLELGDRAHGPLYARLTQALREAIREGRLPSGSALPPSRLLAEQVGCSRSVVTEAYEQLDESAADRLEDELDACGESAGGRARARSGFVAARHAADPR